MACSANVPNSVPNAKPKRLAENLLHASYSARIVACVLAKMGATAFISFLKSDSLRCNKSAKQGKRCAASSQAQRSFGARFSIWEWACFEICAWTSCTRFNNSGRSKPKKRKSPSQAAHSDFTRRHPSSSFMGHCSNTWAKPCKASTHASAPELFVLSALTSATSKNSRMKSNITLFSASGSGIRCIAPAMSGTSFPSEYRPTKALTAPKNPF